MRPHVAPARRQRRQKAPARELQRPVPLASLCSGVTSNAAILVFQMFIMHAVIHVAYVLGLFYSFAPCFAFGKFLPKSSRSNVKIAMVRSDAIPSASSGGIFGAHCV